MQPQPFEIGDISPHKYFAAVSVVLALLFALIENSNQLPLWLNVFLWIFQSIIPMSLMVLSHQFASTFTHFNRINPWWRLFISGCVGAFAFVPLALAADILLNNDPLPQQMSELAYALLDEASGVMPPVVLCWLVINAPWILGFKVIRANSIDEMASAAQPHAATAIVSHNPQQCQDESEPFTPATMPDPLLALLPAQKQGEILYLKSELHYLLVVTSTGQSLILYNLKDAMHACSGIPGIQPHRSYWVSKAAIREFRRQGREGVLILSNQAEIPVSRSKLNSTAQLCDEML